MDTTGAFMDLLVRIIPIMDSEYRRGREISNHTINRLERLVKNASELVQRDDLASRPRYRAMIVDVGEAVVQFARYSGVYAITLAETLYPTGKPYGR